MKSDRERCLSAGMDSYLSKPFEPQTLFTAVEHWTDGGDPHAVVGRAAGPATFDESALLDRLSGDTALMTEVIGLFIEDCPARLAAIAEAVTTRDSHALRTAAHALKGAAASLSALGLFEAAAALEVIGEESRMDAADDAWRHLSAEAGATIALLRQKAFATAD
jgi:HPt (histidine-containing phosphotransfer) domain-containing protein